MVPIKLRAREMRLAAVLTMAPETAFEAIEPSASGAAEGGELEEELEGEDEVWSF
jgi:hypothetical protein